MRNLILAALAAAAIFTIVPASAQQGPPCRPDVGGACGQDAVFARGYPRWKGGGAGMQGQQQQMRRQPGMMMRRGYGPGGPGPGYGRQGGGSVSTYTYERRTGTREVYLGTESRYVGTVYRNRRTGEVCPTPAPCHGSE